MTEEKKKKGPATDGTMTADEVSEGKNVFEEIGDSVGKFAHRTVESIRSTIDKALASRNNVMTIRVSDEADKKMNMLVDAGIFKSRSESAAFLIEEGIKNQEKLFDKITERLETIEKLRNELKDIVSSEFKEEK
jgi:Arc/MetJ-type ribon-helix-helix transcriptional regulator